MSTPAELPIAVVPVGSTPTTGPFAVPFVLGDLSELVVHKAGVPALLNVDFTAAALDATGRTTLTWNAAISSVPLVFRRQTPAGRTEVYGAPLRATSLNAELDRHARRLEDHDAAIGQALSVPEGTAPLVLDLGQFHGKVIGLKADGSAFQPFDLNGSLPDINAIIATVSAAIAPTIAAGVASATAAASASAAASAASAVAAQAAAAQAGSSAATVARLVAAARAASDAASAAAGNAASANAGAQAWASQMGSPVDAAGNWSSQQNALFAAGSAQAASDAATASGVSATASAGSATLAQALAASPGPVTLPDGSTVDSAATSAANALNYATLAAALPCKAITEGTLRPDGTAFIVAGVLTVRREDLFFTFLMTNTGACSFVGGLGVWTGTVLGGGASLAPLRVKRLGAGACTFAAGGSAPLSPAILLQAWKTYRSPLIASGGDAPASRTINVTVPAGTNRKVSVRLGACYNDATVTGRDCTLTCPEFSAAAHPVAGQGTGYSNGTSPSRLDMWTASLPDSPSVATSHVLTLATPTALLAYVAMVEVVANCSALANTSPGFVQSPSTGTAAVSLTPPEAQGLNSVTAFSQGPAADPVAFDIGTMVGGGVTGSNAKRDIAYRHATEARADTAARTYTATEAAHLLGTPSNVPVALLALTYRPVAAGAGATLHAKTGLGSPPALAAGGECWLEAHSGGTDWYLSGPDLA